jgi:hypothetical protein
MAISDEYIAVLRNELGAGFESTTLADLMKAYVTVALKPKVLARRRALVDTTALVTARAAKEKALADEETSRKTADTALVAQLDTDIGSF